MSALMAATDRNKLLGIQVARGVAALLVVFYHAGRLIALPQYVGFIPLGDGFAFGHAGVDFFFVLSGFIIYFVHRPDIGRPRRLATYTRRRLTRIYPIYWVATALVLAIAVLSHGAAGWPDWSYLAKSLLLLPQDTDPLLGVAWTLEHEMLFYVMFALAVAGRRLGIAAFAAWLACILVALLVPPQALIPRFVAASVHLQFFMGIAAAHAVLTSSALHRSGRAALGLAGMGVAAFLAVGLAENAALVSTAGLASQWLFGAASVCILVGLAAAEKQGLIRAGPLAAVFGAASYALYLIHTLVIGLAVHVMAAAGLIRMLPGWVVMAVVIAAALAGGLLLHLLVERPMMARINRRGPSSRPPPAQPVASRIAEPPATRVATDRVALRGRPGTPG